ncbi:hypothetical protein DL95DRAFT_484253 [Leptodontidium sp. 2 PMI_412]|nr:hypothetical protein DL95DRAFT_484253 [Leptodontidium sp. 2 PMI_412]
MAQLERLVKNAGNSYSVLPVPWARSGGRNIVKTNRANGSPIHFQEVLQSNLFGHHTAHIKLIKIQRRTLTDSSSFLRDSDKELRSRTSHIRYYGRSNPDKLMGLDVLLYGEPHPDDTGILQTIQSDLKAGPDLVLVVGTTLKVPGSLSIATNFCRATQSRVGLLSGLARRSLYQE